MTLLQIIILAAVQGAAELLPVSSSAHVIVAEKLMGLDPTAPAMTLLLVMLHTGTMFAVITYFWSSWRQTYFSAWSGFRQQMSWIVLATAATGGVGLVLLKLISHLLQPTHAHFEIEQLFGDTRVISAALAAAGVLILVAARRTGGDAAIGTRSALLTGLVQGLCLPFRGFSRSGATISTALLLGVSRRQAEEFSFALAVALTPVVIVKEAWRLFKSSADTHALAQALTPALLGMVFSYGAGLLALRWLSRWLEAGRWSYFGVYCLFAAAVVACL